MENEKILQELQEIKELLKQLLKEQKYTNENIMTATYMVQETTQEATAQIRKTIRIMS